MDQDNLDRIRTLNEQGVQYLVGPRGQPVAVLLTLEQYDHYLDLLDDERDCQDQELVARLRQARTSPADEDRIPLRAYLRERETACALVSS